MNKNILIIVSILVVVLVAVGAILFKSNSSDKSNATVMPTTNTVVEDKLASSTPEATLTTSSEQSFTVEGGDFFFKPNEIRVKKDSKVKITINNSEGVHDFVIDEFNVKSANIVNGGSTTVEFTADKVGTFEFYCSLGQHRKLGMKGNLIVE